MKLTTTSVRTPLPAGKSEAIFFDDDVPGFGLRLRERGSRTFVFQYKLGTKQRRMALGTATPTNVADVRKIAERLHARVKLGEDPASDKAEAKASAAKTFKVAAADYLDEQRDRLRPRSYPDLERHLTKHAKTLNELQLAKITRGDIASVLKAVAKNSGAVTANRVRTSLMSFFGWAIEQGHNTYAGTNPVIGTARNEEHSRARVLTPPELRLIWNALPEDHFGDILRLLALTGQRADEIAALRWSEIHDDKIVLPGERTKNKRAHVIPLSLAALDIIARQTKRTTASGELRDLLFGLRSGPFSGWSRSKNELDASITKTNGGKVIPHWTPHDLRRTFATLIGGGLPAHDLEKLKGRDKGMATGLGVQPHIVEAVLNHVSGHKAGVAGTYNRSTYEPEKKTALDLWAEHLLAIVESRTSNVTPLRREAVS
jgi:integrase